MKKFYTFSMMVLAVSSLSLNAQSLPEPSLIVPMPGSTAIDVDQLQEFTIDWGTEIALTDGLSTTEKSFYGSYSLLEFTNLLISSGEKGPEITAEEYVLVNVEGYDYLQQLIMGLYTTSVEGDESSIKATGLQCLGWGMYDGEPISLSAVEGEITIEIPAGIVMNADNSSIVNERAQFSFKLYEFFNGSASFSPTPSNLLSENVSYSPEDLKAVTVTWPSSNITILTGNISPSGSSNYPFVKPGSSHGEDMGNGTVDKTIVIEEKYISFTKTALIVDLSWLSAGDWVLEIPAGFVILEGENDDYVNGAGDNCTYLVNVYDGEVSFKMIDNIISVSWEEATNLIINPELNILIQGGNENNVDFSLGLSSSEITVNEEKTLILINLTDLTPDQLPSGYYKLIIPENYVTFEVNGNEIGNTTISYSFEFTNRAGAVSNIGTDSEKVSFGYNLNGVKVDVNQMKNGIYVINGKKVLIK